MSDRRDSIGASEAGAVLGLSQYATPLDVYLRKIGEAPESAEETEAIYWGRALEAAVLARYIRDSGRELVATQQVYRHPSYQWMTATPDAVAVDRVVEIKTAGIRQAAEWGDPGSDAVPPVYLVQVMHQMIVTGRQLADLAVLIGGQDYRVYSIPYDIELAGLIIDREQQFWSAVEAREPPEPTTLRAASLRWPRDTGEVMTASADLIEACQRLAVVRGEIKRLTADAETLELAIKKCMADASVLQTPDGRRLATWTVQTARRIDTKALAAEHPDIAEQFRKPSTSRVFRLKEIT